MIEWRAHLHRRQLAHNVSLFIWMLIRLTELSASEADWRFNDDGMTTTKQNLLKRANGCEFILKKSK